MEKLNFHLLCADLRTRVWAVPGGRKVARSTAAGGKSELSRARGRVTPAPPGIHAGDPSTRAGRQTVPQKTNRRGSFAICGKGEKAG